MTYTSCINCDEWTENIGGLCPVCMGKAQKRAEKTRQAAQDDRGGLFSGNPCMGIQGEAERLRDAEK